MHQFLFPKFIISRYVRCCTCARVRLVSAVYSSPKNSQNAPMLIPYLTHLFTSSANTHSCLFFSLFIKLVYICLTDYRYKFYVDIYHDREQKSFRHTHRRILPASLLIHKISQILLERTCTNHLACCIPTNQTYSSSHLALALSAQPQLMLSSQSNYRYTLYALSSASQQLHRKKKGEKTQPISLSQLIQDGEKTSAQCRMDLLMFVFYHILLSAIGLSKTFEEFNKQQTTTNK